ncbi:MAG: preprotein translocase subunit YajC [Gaiellales bacterium]|nr:MAG: preprotein translocase subunit YajC [Gaiellales bacterium]
MISLLTDLTFVVAQNGEGGEEASTSSPYITYGIIALMVVLFYFLLVRPGQKQRRAHQDLVGSVRKGDEIMTAGGFYGTVRKVADDHVMLELNKGNIVKFSRNSIARIVSQEPAEEVYEEEEELTEEEV